LHKRQVSQNLIEQVAQLEAAEMLDEEGFEQAIGEQLGALSEQHQEADQRRGAGSRLSGSSRGAGGEAAGLR
jgi:hypothetical protein